MNKILTKRMQVELDEKVKANTYNRIKIFESAQGAKIMVDDKSYLNMYSNNYLGFCNDPITKNAAIEAINKFGVGTGGVRSISGSNQLHIDLENAIAKFKGSEAVLLLQSGFQANVAVVPTICTANDVIISDEFNHASMIDAARLTKAKRFIYKHADMDDLRAKMSEAQAICAETKGFILIMTDSVFSMDGDIAPLNEIVKIKKEYENVLLMVDDAHGEGVLGEYGRGASNHFEIEGKVDIETGTLSKAFGVTGGIVGGSKEFIDYLRQKARPFLFSAAIGVGSVSGAIAVVAEMSRSDERLKKLWENTKYLQDGLRKKGFDLGKTATPITPVFVGEESMATDMVSELAEVGVAVGAIMFPTVPRGRARIRLMPSSIHTKENLDEVIEKIDVVANKLGVARV